ncbi:bifunctional 5,10-methylenetetrahydrofolate dehydrogenase/5,10-methenyltetrahydrofolate cyclohydrolase [Patescibacteria group bacterium]|nr:bifunctional 5,10-methylenetetrahydrofolate dehydrogenase/5,10-methenyltetrahydrofolate cyclohydrolase [Patescibacteria group bacterium]
MAEILSGRLLAENIRAKAKARIQKLAQPPGLAAILVGPDPASHLYVSLKEEAAKDIGIYFEKFVYPANVSQDDLIKKIKKLNTRDDIHGVLVQLPLPAQDEDKVVNAIDPIKDIDGFHPESRRRLQAGQPGLVPPVSLASMRLIQASHQPLKDKSAVIISNNPIFAEPLIELMKETGITAQFLPSTESALAAKTRAADIIVVAVGQPDFITKDMVKEGAIVIDIGTNKKDGETVGDVADDVQDVAGFLSPVPGGVGPLTVAYLIMNILKAATLRAQSQ